MNIYPSPLNNISNFHSTSISEWNKQKLWDNFAAVSLVTASSPCKRELTLYSSVKLVLEKSLLAHLLLHRDIWHITPFLSVCHWISCIRVACCCSGITWLLDGILTCRWGEWIKCLIKCIILFSTVLLYHRIHLHFSVKLGSMNICVCLASLIA